MINLFRGTYRFLSNMYCEPLTYNGLVWPSAEHAYQAAKCIDAAEREHIRAMPDPRETKAYVKQSMRTDWSIVKLSVMRAIIAKKFVGDLADRLLATCDVPIVEGNTWGDTYWGVCNGIGTNWLGKLLMARREQLRNGIYVASRVKHAGMWQTLRAEGMPILSTWIDEANPSDMGELWQRIVTEVAACKQLLLYADVDDLPIKGALVEVGMALAHGKPVVVVAPDLLPTVCLGSWIEHPLVTFKDAI